MGSRTDSPPRPRVACFTPLPPARTGVATYTAGLLPHLARELSLEAFVDQRRVDCPSLEGLVPVSHALRFPLRAGEFDLLLYEMGNNSAHRTFFELLLRYPGIVQMHDVVFHHFYLDTYFQRGRRGDYARRVRAVHGRDGATIARAVLRDFGGSLGYFELEMRDELAARSLGVVVHSEWARARLRERFPSLPILRIVLPALEPPAPGEGAAELRRRRRIPADAFVVTSLGFATPSKRLERVLEALPGLRARMLSVRLLVVGEVDPEVRLGERAAALGVSDLLVVTGYVSDREVWGALAASDVVVGLRHPSAGEASGPLMQAMALGVPVVVSAFRQFLEIPDAACEKIPLGAGEVPALASALEALAADPARRRRMGEAARRYVREEASPTTAARAIATFARVLLPLSRSRLEAARRTIRDERRRLAAVASRRATSGLPTLRDRSELAPGIGGWIAPE